MSVREVYVRKRLTLKHACAKWRALRVPAAGSETRAEAATRVQREAPCTPPFARGDIVEGR